MKIFIPVMLVLMVFFILKWHFYSNQNLQEYTKEQKKFRNRMWTIFLMMISPIICAILDSL